MNRRKNLGGLIDKVINEDCLVGMKELPDNSIDLIATDPPYGISFMGKAWDRAISSVDIWHECLRVLKPGAFAFVMCIPRQDCLARMVVALEEAGFNVSFTSMYHCFGSGFPKAMSISKAVDKRNARTQETYRPFAKYLKKKRIEKKLSMAEIDKILDTNTAYSWWEGRLSGIQLPSKKYYQQLKKILNLDDRFDKLIERSEAEREIVGIDREKFARYGADRKERKGKWHGDTWDGLCQDAEIASQLTLPATPQAQALDGSYSGFSPKPAVECILVAMKPLETTTYVDQALRNGKGVTWLDDCRIPYKSESDKANADRGETLSSYGGNEHFGGGDKRHKPFTHNQGQGRFPANLLASDDALNDGRVIKSSWVTGRGGKYSIWKHGKDGGIPKMGRFDDGSFSRYFSLDSWFAKKLAELPRGVQRTFPFLLVAKASKAEKNRGCEGLEEKRLTGNQVIPPLRCANCGKQVPGTARTINRPNSTCSCGNYVPGEPVSRTTTRNNHPTCKPLKLMSYLITLGSRPGDIVLDPFLGSGTTAIAARMLHRRYIGYETDPDYCRIAEARLAAVQERLI